MNKKVVLGMSGGVDSSVAAYLLKKQGYDVFGITLKTLKNEDEGIFNDAKKVADMLSIPYKIVDVSESFSKNVIDYFTSEYLNGRTPNPCVVCNRLVKFEAMYDYAVKNDIDFIATGHYAKIEYDKAKKRYILLKSEYDKKDQSYVLYNLTQNQLSKIIFPLFDYPKDEIRKIAKDIGLLVADKKDSQEICFIPDNDYAAYIKNRVGYLPPEGDFIDLEGNVIGKHKGIIHYTIGQRKGLGMTFGQPMFVTKINPIDNTVTLGKMGSQYKNTIIAKNPNFISIEKLDEPTYFLCKARYSAKPEKALVTMLDDNTLKVEFEACHTAAAPGQAVVFYDDNVVVGGATIIDAY